MHLVMFDIDGTLTETYDVDTDCYVQALVDVLDFTNVNTDWSLYPHCSDSGILETLCRERLNRSPLAAENSAVQKRFMELLHAATREQPFQPVRGASEFVQTLLADRSIAVALATGGWKCSARMKLQSAGLHVLDLPTAFADDAQAREDIMQCSLVRAANAHQVVSFAQRTYIGDGVWDARAARNLGFRFFGIARDAHKAERLLAEGAVRVFPDYQSLEFLPAILQHEA